MKNRVTRGRAFAAVAAVGVLSVTLAACSSGSSTTEEAAPAASEAASAPAAEAGAEIAVSLITKNQTNPFFVAMAEGAQQAADANGVTLTLASGKDDTDVAGQVAAIENAVSQGQAGILITPAGPGVNDAITAARAAGLLVIALDTPTDPADIVDITFATDNFVAGQAIGQWAAGKLDGAKAVIARLIITDAEALTVDYKRDNGFLDGMGIAINDEKVMGDEETTGKYTTGKGGDYEIACLVAWKIAFRRTRTSTWSTRSMSPQPSVLRLPSRQPARPSARTSRSFRLTAACPASRLSRPASSVPPRSSTPSRWLSTALQPSTSWRPPAPSRL